jgi:hypothetical protein
MGARHADGPGDSETGGRADNLTGLGFHRVEGGEWLEPTLEVELTYSELMEGRLRDPLFRSGIEIGSRPKQ